MPASLTVLERTEPEDAGARRRARILDAAERCFVRAGFHRTTMQDVAAEAGMSPGNLYRYFPSKDAIVVGLAERDRAALAEDFEALGEADDLAESFARVARKHVADEPRAHAVLGLEIWAESTRSPALARLAQECEAEVEARLVAILEQAKARGALAPGRDARALAVLIATLADGLFVRRAVVPHFDPAREIAQFAAVVRAAFAGGIDLVPAPAAEPAAPGTPVPEEPR